MSARVSKLQRNILWRIAHMEYANKKYQRDGIPPLTVTSYQEMPALNRLVARKILVENPKGRVNLAAEYRGTYMIEAITEWKTLRSVSNAMKVSHNVIQEAATRLTRDTVPLSMTGFGHGWTDARKIAHDTVLPMIRAQIATLTVVANNLETALNHATAPTVEEIKVELVTKELETG